MSEMRVENIRPAEGGPLPAFSLLASTVLSSSTQPYIMYLYSKYQADENRIEAKTMLNQNSN